MATLVMVALVGCANKPTLDVTETPSASQLEDTSLNGVVAAELTPALKAEFDDAQALAKSRKSDATFFALTALFPPDLEPNRAKRVYVFGSASEPDDWWTVTVNEATGERVRALIPKADFLGGTLTAVPMQFWKVNVIEALQIGELSGGKTFREQNPGAEVTASLAVQGPNGWLWWVVSYRSVDGGDLKIRIHPATGELYDEEGNVTAPNPSVPVTSIDGQET